MYSVRSALYVAGRGERVREADSPVRPTRPGRQIARNPARLTPFHRHSMLVLMRESGPTRGVSICRSCTEASFVPQEREGLSLWLPSGSGVRDVTAQGFCTCSRAVAQSRASGVRRQQRQERAGEVQDSTQYLFRLRPLRKELA